MPGFPLDDKRALRFTLMPLLERAFRRDPEMMIKFRDELAGGSPSKERFLEICEAVVRAGDVYDA
jgi:hypothetical protein